MDIFYYFTVCQTRTLLKLHTEDTVIIARKHFKPLIMHNRHLTFEFHLKSTRCVLHAHLTLPNNDQSLHNLHY